MKKLFLFLSIFFILWSCHNKKQEVSPLPDATFTVSVNNNNVATFSFTANKNDIYTFDFGDGERLTGILDYIGANELMEHKHIYRKNGNFTIKLTLYNKYGSDQKQKIVDARNASVADFSYEVLANGKLKLKNLSQNPRYGHKWLIGDTSYNGSYWFYTSTEQDPIVNIDLNGKYQIRLEVPGEYSASMKEDTVYIKNAKRQMTFSGLYKGKTAELSIDGTLFHYKGITTGGIMSPYGLSQQLWESTSSHIVYSKFYNFPNDNLLQPLSKEGQY
ncbi:PKD domain-containing protein [Emticicia agri]|uniref:PKD domain-containing protein n=1 Tax=Emticicia agri TaxID=2492393 RepID=A0A4Q5M3G9_9BACT|nr:PKD domain-containing protein [Emticicia agri]RYU96695.1 hypothetical protein EWM59_05970 [Emticicia agri]